MSKLIWGDTIGTSLIDICEEEAMAAAHCQNPHDCPTVRDNVAPSAMLLRLKILPLKRVSCSTHVPNTRGNNCMCSGAQRVANYFSTNRLQSQNPLGWVPPVCVNGQIHSLYQEPCFLSNKFPAGSQGCLACWQPALSSRTVGAVLSSNHASFSDWVLSCLLLALPLTAGLMERRDSR